MTIAIGFACQDGIIVASDSHVSSGGDSKRPNERKLFSLALHGHVKGAVLAIP